MLRTIYGDNERYEKTYWSEFEDMYFTGDGARKDEDGYIWIMGRVDDVVNVSGHRLGTSEAFESALVSYEAVAEAAVVSRPDEIIKGNAFVAFVTLKDEYEWRYESAKRSATTLPRDRPDCQTGRNPLG